MIINTNIAALNSYNRLSSTNNNMQKSLERLSSGKRINKAADDAAGLAISEKMKAQIRGLAQAQRNAQDGISLIQTAEGALKETHAILQKMRELAVQSANDTNTDDDRAELQKEVSQLIEELNRIAQNTEFNTMALLDGTRSSSSGGTALVFHIGANANQTMEVSIENMSASGLSVQDVDISSHSGANQAIGTVDSAIGLVSSERSKLGAIQNRLEHTINNLGAAEENLTAANSRIEDIDMAKEMMEFTKSQILSQAGTAMLAQANMMPQGVLQLLG
ncbi:MAG: flagellin [Halanaerobiaceae bacterium]|nr:flagellin [Halanaerobiaceae bacterium]